MELALLQTGALQTPGLEESGPRPAGALGEGDTSIDRSERGDHMKACRFLCHVPRTALATVVFNSRMAGPAMSRAVDGVAGRSTPDLRTCR